MAPSGTAANMDAGDEECICLLEECVCGLTRGADVPGAHDPLVLAPKAVTILARAGKPVEVTLSDAASTSTAAAESSFDEVGQKLVDDGAEGATAAKGRTGLSLLGKSWWRPEASGVQEELAAPDLKVQLDAASKQEYARLKTLGPRGRKDAKALQHTPPTVDELSPEQLEVLGAFCELQLGRQLLAACAEGDQAAVEALWGDIYGADDSDTYEHAQRLPGLQETPLAAAAAHGHTALAAWLLEGGAALDATDSDGRTAFWWACCEGHGHTAAMLLDAGAAMNSDAQGEQVLSAAVSAGHDGVVQLLLERAPPPAAPLGARAAAAHPGGADFATAASRSPASPPRAGKPAASRSPERARGGSKPAKTGAAAGAAAAGAAAAGAAAAPPPRHGWVPVEVTEAMLRDAVGHGFDDIAEALRRHLDTRGGAAAAVAQERTVLVERHARVRLQGLQGRPELNGRVGHVKAFDAASGRFEVDLRGEEVVQVRPACGAALDEGCEYPGGGGQQQLEAAAAAAVAELTEASEAAAAPLPYVALGCNSMWRGCNPMLARLQPYVTRLQTQCCDAAPLCD
jgi:hypothetical protein